MLTDRGRWILAFGGAVYLVAWAFGTTALYPIGLGLVLAVAAAALWVRLLNRPMRVNRTLGKGEHLAGDDIPVRLEIDVGGRMPSGALTVVERIAKFGEVETVILSRHGRLRGAYVLDAVPRGRYPIEARLDLHGMTQEEAHRALSGFVVRSRAAGRRVVLVITGHGRVSGGILKAAVPRWLNEPELRRHVLAITGAQPRDGGTGALYLLLRKGSA